MDALVEFGPELTSQELSNLCYGCVWCHDIHLNCLRLFSYPCRDTVYFHVHVVTLNESVCDHVHANIHELFALCCFNIAPALLLVFFMTAGYHFVLSLMLLFSSLTHFLFHYSYVLFSHHMTLKRSDSFSSHKLLTSLTFLSNLSFIASHRLGLMRADYHSLPDKAIDALELHYDRWVSDDDSFTLYRKAVYHSIRLRLTLTILHRIQSLLLIFKSPILTTASMPILLPNCCIFSPLFSSSVIFNVLTSSYVSACVCVS